MQRLLAVWLLAVSVYGAYDCEGDTCAQQEVFPGPSLRPLAREASVVQVDDWRITFLTHQLIRLELSGSHRYEDEATQLAWFRGDFETPKFTKDVDSETKTVKFTTFAPGSDDPVLELTVPGPVVQQLPSIRVFETDKTWQFGPKFNATTKANLGGTARTLDNADGDIFKARYLQGPVSVKGFYDTMRSVEGDWLSGWHVDQGLCSRDGFFVLEDQRSPLYVDGWPKARLDRKDELYFDLYFFGHGLNYQQAVRDYFTLSGYPPVVPNYALGVWWSRWFPYTQPEIVEIANEFENHGAPLSVMVLDMDWHTAGAMYRKTQDNNYWAGYTFNLDMFPDPKGLFDFLHSKGIKNCLNLHPAGGVSPVEDVYPEVVRKLGKKLPAGKAVQFDPTNKKFIEVYFDQLIAPLERMGVDMFWNDWQQGMAPNKRLDPTGLWTTTIQGVDPMWWVNHVFSLGAHNVGPDDCEHPVPDAAVHHTAPGWLDWITGKTRKAEDPSKLCPPAQRSGYGERIIVSRFCGRGSHRYPIGFSGDTFITWESIQFQVGFTVRASNVGYDWWSHDIGGYQDFSKASLWQFFQKLSFKDHAKLGEEFGKALAFIEKEYPADVAQFAKDTLAPTLKRHGAGSLTEVDIKEAKLAIRVLLSNLDAELFARWAQLGVFSPIFRMHSNQETDRRPWLLREPFKASVIASLQLRNALLPYLEQASVRHHTHGDALVNPLYFDRKLALVNDAYKYSTSEFFFGPALLVAPLTSARGKDGKSELKVWLPHASSPAGWRSFFTGKAFYSDKMKVNGDIHTTPVWARGGSVVPMVELDESVELRFFAGTNNATEVTTYHTEVPLEGWRLDVTTHWSASNGVGSGTVTFRITSRADTKHMVTLSLWDDGNVKVEMKSSLSAVETNTFTTVKGAGLPLISADIADLDEVTVSVKHIVDDDDDDE